jgi:hypothetical protein
MEQLVGWSTLKDDFVTWVNRLVDGPIVILRQNKPVGVMMSYEEFQTVRRLIDEEALRVEAGWVSPIGSKAPPEAPE